MRVPSRVREAGSRSPAGCKPAQAGPHLLFPPPGPLSPSLRLPLCSRRSGQTRSGALLSPGSAEGGESRSRGLSAPPRAGVPAACSDRRLTGAPAPQTRPRQRRLHPGCAPFSFGFYLIRFASAAPTQRAGRSRARSGQGCRADRRPASSSPSPPPGRSQGGGAASEDRGAGLEAREALAQRACGPEEREG